MTEFALLLTALLFGGMTFFSFGFAPVLFKQLPMAQVRPLLRGTFPYYYLAIILLSAICALVALGVSGLAAGLLGLICLATIYARQVLMPQINAATDREDQTLFKRLHGLSVVIQLIQIGLAGWAVLLFS
ncbi:hypothetical protein So717_36680 [Roseobacter cerasinus]|uniref:TMEM205-like domain-containing protein n=1 Tax=Roseobacter cerasinus TaxID=2602289 RepID=A0A640VY98_9RHOB|nr:DUF4149 domain-containing protein [Roseobacter cerasinus]GFE51915.1 hypothetical protein So717_36680 [Roseobacter cerasinus]